ncbi:putative transcription factor C2H2 family [Dioscorea sansibarensis]
MTDMKGGTSTTPDACAQYKEWDEVSCSICMDHPHNAVLLICSSHEKGCQSYICDTSYRHSNCLDRFKQSRVNLQDNTSHPEFSVNGNVDEQRFDQGNNGLPVVLENNNDIHEQSGLAEAQTDERISREESGEQVKPDNLKCPLCRGTVMGWIIVKEARQYMDLKSRSCSRESCTFSGNYRELRRHARRVHPTTRPAEVDPSRQRAWRRMEHQREYGDIISAIRSAMPGAIVFGDYVLDGGEGLPLDRDTGEGDGPWWTTFFLLRMISSPNGSLNGRRGITRPWRMHHRSARRRYLWGENLLGLQDEDDDDDDVRILDEEDVSIPRRRRRRFVRARTDELP